MGGYPPYGTGPGGFPIPVGTATDGAAATAEVGQKVVVHLSGGGERGGGVEPVETYIWRRRNTVAQYISTRPILDMCEAAEIN